MKNISYWFWIAVVAWFCLFCFWGGCPSANSRDPSKLLGVWRSAGQGMDVIWTFEPNGSFRYQTEVQNSWMNLFVGKVDVSGQWAMEQNILTIEFSETPLSATLAGGTWKGTTSSVHIHRLNDSELTFYDSDLKFRRSLAPVK
ncbi:hypothetical protein [Schlesneria paludicola]|uniref:hypothetical protein n=1 Tax=Schlesneria paludicola TaxID=360056 RepID=UPI0012FAAEB0|nr:hypothetical protein [Schlesneria paludicola]